MQTGAVVLLLLVAQAAAQTENPLEKCEALLDKLDSCLSNNELILKVFNDTAKQLEKQCDENKEMMKKQAEKQEKEKDEMKKEMEKLKKENEELKKKAEQCEKEKEMEKMKKDECKKEKKEAEDKKKECEMMMPPTPPPPATTTTTTTTTTTPPPPPPEGDDLTDVIQELKKCEKKVADLLTAKKEMEDMPKPPPTESPLQMMNISTGTYYYDKKKRYTWKDADALCRSLGLQLASFDTQQKLSNFWSASSSLTWGPWTSGSYRGYQPGDFHWANGQKINPNLWRLGQPDEYGYGKDSCAYIYDGALYDEPCSEKNNVICEQPPQPPSLPPFFTYG